ncbi:pentatricopeptide repeat-containing protein At4g02750 [Selaginella moellendorffii]|nr:pentatricopeptide repeat-containing protein At4g02750 [Selaginella moellendorffii]|eukprot:XP_002963814.2 pentatricopeptide repeat-containing protein At4g02750 [Selaginella moellendorffii]
MNAASLVRQYAASRALLEGKRLHSQLKRDGADRNTLIGNLLVAMYAQCGCLDQARLAFDRISQRNIYSWNIMVTANAQRGHCRRGEEAFDRMPHRNVVSWNTMIRAFVQSNDLVQARHCFDQIPDRDNVSWNIMLAAYAQRGHVESAAKIFARIEKPDVISLNTVISAYAQHGHASIAMDLLLGEMAGRDFVSWNTVLAGLTKEGKLEQAKELFRRIPQRDALAWMDLFQELGRQGRIEESKALFDEIPRRDIVSWTGMLQAYARNGNVAMARRIFDRMPEQDDVSCTVMLGGYSDNGNLEKAREFFCSFQSNDPVGWTAMIHAYARNGHHEQALWLFLAMDLEGVRIDHIAILAALNSCASIPSLSVGRIIHEEIVEQKLDTDLSMRTAVLDMYAKCGKLEVARDLFFVHDLHRDAVSWNALIAAHAASGGALDTLWLFALMILDGISPIDSTFVSVLCACSHAGMVEVACHCFATIASDYDGIFLTPELYMIVIDVLARAGQLERAEELFHGMPFEPDAVSWRSVAGACRVQGEMIRVSLEQEHDDNPASYVVFSNLCVG